MLNRATIALLNFVFPHPASISEVDKAKLAQAQRDTVAKIEGMTRSRVSEALLEAAKRVQDEEEGRKSSAEARATAFIAAVATLVPLLTWAIGTTTPACSPGWQCVGWTGVFSSAVLYLMLAGFWSLKTLSVANYVRLGAEDVRKLSYDRDPELAIAREALISARCNQDTINRKLDFLMAAQRAFYCSLVLLGLLLLSDPLMRLHFVASDPRPLRLESPAASKKTTEPDIAL